VIQAVADSRVGVIGANSLVGTCLLPLLTEAGCAVSAFARGPVPESSDGVHWQSLGSPALDWPVRLWICVAPIWVLPDHFALLRALGVRRIVVLSSTSRFSKADSSNRAEQAIARRLAAAESRFQNWAQHHGIEWIILRPTLIYGLGRDKNITELARFIRRFRILPLLGRADGLRQPIHARDVGVACVAALRAAAATGRAYDLSGGETITYREMVARLFASLAQPVRLVQIPLPAFRLAVSMLRLMPRYRHWSVAMAQRMNSDLVFDHAAATRDFQFSPRSFLLTQEDLPLP